MRMRLNVLDRVDVRENGMKHGNILSIKNHMLFPVLLALTFKL